ncbi:MAG: hypothetical protein NTW36_11805, partial [Planctomycetia bacterium]|nr:hypothetical protein [Planctomycetia bacterium]
PWTAGQPLKVVCQPLHRLVGKNLPKVLPSMPLNQIDSSDLHEFAIGQRWHLTQRDALALQELG